MMIIPVSEKLLTTIAEQRGVKLIEFEDSGLFFVEYWNARGDLRVRSSLMSYQEAENNFVRRVEEEDYR